MGFVGIHKPQEFRRITRAHVIAWRDDLKQRSLSGVTLRHRLAALSSLFEYLCEKNAVTHNPVKGVKRPPIEGYDGKAPALSDYQARRLLDAPDSETVKGKRDRAILTTLLYHALRREELCTSEATIGRCSSSLPCRLAPRPLTLRPNRIFGSTASQISQRRGPLLFRPLSVARHIPATSQNADDRDAYLLRNDARKHLELPPNAGTQST